MLQINMADVVNVIKSLVPYLVAIGVFMVLAVIISIAVNKKTVKNVGTRKFVRSETWLVAMVAIVAAVSMMLTGPMATLLNNVSAKKYELSQSTVDKGNKLAEDIQSEAVTLLKNDGNNLPLSSKKVNVFGWGSTNPVYGGTGSGSMSKQYPTVSLLQGMKNAGLEPNDKLSKLYTDYRKDRPEVGMFAQDWTLPEVPADRYSQSLIDQAKSYSDQAVVVISRVGGEGADLPTNMKAKDITYTNNSKNYEDFQEGESILQLDQTEKNMLDLVAKNFQNVTVVYNGANTFQFDFLDQYPQVKSLVWCPPAGQTGFTSLGRVLAGDINPSGRTADTFLKDLKKSVTYNNSGDFKYNNVDEFAQSFAGFTGKTETVKPTFINYTEGIYVGYRFYETAAKEGLIDYNSMVRYPFGYGLSYTKFSEKMGSINHSNGKVSFDVTVKNDGSKAGKDVVQVYYNPPYTEGGIEKASTNLVAFAKTDVLKPGASQTVKIEFNDSDMASYDSKGARAYVLEQGQYEISVQSDSHTVIDTKTVTVDSTTTYNAKGKAHNGDKTPATNIFDKARGENVTYLSRAGHFANFAAANSVPTDFKMSDKVKSEFVNNGNYKAADHNQADDKMPTTGAKNNVRLASLRGKSFDDPEWDKLLDQLTFKEMDELIANGGYGTAAIDSIGKARVTDADGPASLNNNFTKAGSIGFPASTAVAATFNKDLAKRFGELIGEMGHDMHVAGWYAPAMNVHRDVFGGRNFEYFSEDPLVAGTMASNQAAGAQSKGVYAFIKHFAMNEQESNRTNMLCTWADEQAMREVYLKPFEMSVKTGGARAVMSSFNYIGPTYAGANPALLQSLLRDEWGFKGFVVTDYYAGYGFQNADQIIRNGGDTMLATTKVTNHITDKSATSVIAMRRATKNVLYTVVNSWEYEKGEPKAETPIWRTAMYAAWVVFGLLFIGLEVVAIRRFRSRREAAKVTEALQSVETPEQAVSDEMAESVTPDGTAEQVTSEEE
ncbi:beta-glucosidase [Bifidobacterium commune]|uniref:Beta-glucosidase n=1 Tax=Bifidobacterium commune TaxID=1505727 RepID=A0A1C4H6G1_9BIFI|nr:glycoside hydrolase family 3 N-terminal domain-containing protein [Bifidobacterium commune]MBB2955492.1 beta-glucosidase [Bifidobacterium commune]SCC80260.1 beta-glucosidase [Bifidobacterium commune]